MEIRVRRVAIGFVVAAVVLAVLVGSAGIDGVLEALGALRGPTLGVLAAIAGGWLAAWGLGLRTVLGTLGIPVNPGRAVLLYATAAFSNNVTPFGQAGGEPLAALLLSRATGARYERCLAAIASLDALNFVPSIALGLLGLSYYAFAFTVGDRVVALSAAAVALAVVVPSVGYVLWRRRTAVQRAVVAAVAPVVGSVGRFIPRYTPPPAPEIQARIEGFFGGIERVAGDRAAVVATLGFSTAGWLCMVAVLWVALTALAPGRPITLFAAALIAVPAGGFAAVTPLPGGLGGVEFIVVAVVVPITGLTAGTATAAALVYRGAVYWLPTLVGGGAAAWFEGQR